MDYLKRVIDNQLQDYLDAFEAVNIEGPKWCGKTTTAKQKAASIIELQDTDKRDEYLATARTKASLLLEGDTNGVTRAHSKAVAIKMVASPSTLAVDIRSDYVARHGTPSAAAPKIFFRYYLVNTATGDKSGTMLTECKWTAGE